MLPLYCKTNVLFLQTNLRLTYSRYTLGLTRKDARVVEEARLESVYTPKGYRGFESLSFRKKGVNQWIMWFTPFSFLINWYRKGSILTTTTTHPYTKHVFSISLLVIRLYFPNFAESKIRKGYYIHVITFKSNERNDRTQYYQYVFTPAEEAF